MVAASSRRSFRPSVSDSSPRSAGISAWRHAGADAAARTATGGRPAWSHCPCRRLSPHHPRSPSQADGAVQPGLSRPAVPANRISPHLGGADRRAVAASGLSHHGQASGAGTRPGLRGRIGRRTRHHSRRRRHSPTSPSCSSGSCRPAPRSRLLLSRCRPPLPTTPCSAHRRGGCSHERDRGRYHPAAAVAA